MTLIEFFNSDLVNGILNMFWTAGIVFVVAVEIKRRWF